MDNNTITPLFSTPIYSCELNKQIVDRASSALKELEYENMDSIYSIPKEFYSLNKNVLDLPEYTLLKNEVMLGVDDYIRGYLGVPSGCEFYITNSWVNKIQPGGEGAPHDHSNSIISGVLYLDTKDNSGDLNIHKDHTSMIPFPSTFLMDHDFYNIYNSTTWRFPPTQYKMILFPSSVMHSISVNDSDTIRWSLAFNTFIRGTINTRKLSRLII